MDERKDMKIEDKKFELCRTIMVVEVNNAEMVAFYIFVRAL